MAALKARGLPIALAILAGARALLAVAGEPAPEPGDPAAELRALRGYLGLWVSSRDSSDLASAGASQGGPRLEGDAGALAADLRARLDRFLDRSDLSAPFRAGGLEVFHELARSLREAAASSGALAPRRSFLREVHAELIRRAEAAGLDSVPWEIEMLRSSEVGLESPDAYARMERILPRLRDRAASLEPAAAQALRQTILRLLSDRAWPDLEAGEGLPALIDILERLPGGVARKESEVVVAKLIDWKSRLVREGAARQGEEARGTALVNLYRAAEIAAPRLEAGEVARILDGLELLRPPSLGESPPGCDGTIRSLEIAEVRMCPDPASPQGRGHRLPPLPRALIPGLPEGTAGGYLLVPRSAYQVLLAANAGAGGTEGGYWVLARAGAEGELVLPRCVPAGMVPITSPETGRISFLADRRPWTIRRFLLAFQRAGNRLAMDPDAVERIHRHSVLREIPLPAEGRADFSAIAGLLATAALKERLEETFWVEAEDRAGRAAAHEIAGAVLNGNTGLRDTTLSLPTVAEANRLWRDGERFALELSGADSGFGLFNAIRLVPEPKELKDRPRYAIRTVLRLAP